MVQTYQSPVRVYKHPFELIMAAYEKRFPTCPQIPIFVGCEVTFEHKSEDGAVEVIERKCQLNVDAPYILKKISGVDYVYFMQKNTLDRRKRTLTIQAHNVSFSSRIVVNESCFYYVHPENVEWTCFEQSASLDVKSFFGFESTVEKIAVKQYAANIQKGKEIIEYFVNELIEQGTTYVHPFEDTDIPGSPTDSAIEIAKNEDSVSLLSVEGEQDEKVKAVRSRSGTVIKLVAQPSIENVDAKLETEYIHRFLGELTPLEESRLCQLKYWLQDTHQCRKLPNDAHLLRFLRARDFDVVKAREMVTNSMMWRKQHNVDKILSTYHPPPVLLQFFPGCWHHCDLEGRPLFVLRLGQLDIKGLLRAIGVDGLVKFVLSICEEGLNRTAEATKNLGKPISTWTLLVDLEGLSMRHLWRPGVSALLRIIEIAEAHYPETMGLALIVRAPRVFPVLWTLVGPLIDENTRKKFMIEGSSDTLTELKSFIQEEYIPDFVGGNCFCLAPEGGHVPKVQCSPTDNQTEGKEESQGHVLESIYQTGHVYKGIPQETLVPVGSKGCVLTWDFDVVKGSCEFSVLRTTGIIHPETVREAHSPPASVLSPGVVAAAISTQQSTVAFDRNLQLGVDLFIEEKPFLCHEGDSMQGSHFCNRPGTYILQWKHPEMPHAQGSFDFTLPVQKCKVMFYHELIDSAEFKGSMASLESCRSSFSSLSLATSKNSGTDTPPTTSKRESAV